MGDRWIGLLRAEVDADGEFAGDRVVAVELGGEGPLVQGNDAGDRQLTVFCRFQDHHRHLRVLRHEQARLHPVVDRLAVQRRGNRGPGRGFRHRSQLLVLVQRQTVDVDLRQFDDVRIERMVRLMRRFIADRSPSRDREHQAESTKDCATAGKNHHSIHPIYNAFTIVFLYHQMPNKVIHQGRRELGD